MGLLDGIEKLITEHGSAAILKERIQLVNDRHTALERERDQLRAQVTRLETQLQAARAQIQEVRRAQHQADEDRQGQAAQALQRVHGSEAHMRMLLEIAARPDQSTAVLATATGLSSQRVTLQAEALLAAGLVQVQRFDGISSFGVAESQAWSPTVAGLQHLEERGQLP